MTANLDRDNINWVSKLAAIKLAYNSKVHGSTGVTSALAFLGHEIKLPINLMMPAPENPPSKYKWLINLQETYAKIFDRMYAAQDSINRTNANLYSNKKAPFAVGDIVTNLLNKVLLLGKTDKVMGGVVKFHQGHDLILSICPIA